MKKLIVLAITSGLLLSQVNAVFAATWPSGATGKCRDGSFSYAMHRQGMCSRHGGVAAYK
jgi:hypothetical protein